MNNSYIINKNTLLIKSTIDKKGVVIFDDKKTINLDIVLHKFINDCCKYYGNSYKGKFESSKIYLNKNIKLPIIISENYELIIFPTNSIRNPNCIWIVYNNIDNIKKLDNKNTIIIFKNGIEFCVNCSYNVINNQINNCARLKCVLIERKRALNV